jgi:hypothetical protein
VKASPLLAMIKEIFMKLRKIIVAFGAMFAVNGFAKIPPAPPPDPVVAAAKAEKDKAAADKTKLDQARYEDKAVASFQANMKKAGKPVPKPTPIIVAVAPVVPTTVAAVPVVEPSVASKPLSRPATDSKVPDNTNK